MQIFSLDNPIKKSSFLSLEISSFVFPRKVLFWCSSHPSFARPRDCVCKALFDKMLTMDLLLVRDNELLKRLLVATEMTLKSPGVDKDWGIYPVQR